MPTPEALNALADRVEREEPGRELDEALERATRNRAHGAWVPRYTTSLDAAVTLVPKGWYWLHSSFDVMTCVKKTDDDKEWPPRIHGTGRTPALALCAASLRARASLTQTE